MGKCTNVVGKRTALLKYLRDFSFLQKDKLYFSVLVMKGNMPKHCVHTAGRKSAHGEVKICSDYFKFTLQENDELDPFKDKSEPDVEE